MREAEFYKRLSGKKVKCGLCPWSCLIPEGKTGYCGVRKNVKGILYSLVYGIVASTAVDPIEKKPLFHFAPGSLSFSFSTVGCNLKCKHCQNWEISHEYGEIFGRELLPEEIVKIAKGTNSQGIAYTYTEPTVFFEYAFETMKLAKKEGLYNVWVTNGYTSPEVIKTMSKYLDAANVDWKGNNEFYKKNCSGLGVEPVKKALEAYKENGVWVEITNLLIPGLNDSEDDIVEMVKWVKDNLGADVPIHFSAFYPQYKLRDIPPTPVGILENAVNLAMNNGMHWVYLGNVYGHPRESTTCWKCGEVLIKRLGFSVHSVKDKCRKCRETVPLRGMKWARK